ncbi:MAG: hypothetical protein WCA77_05780 [Thermoplasmata archaeon]
MPRSEARQRIERALKKYDQSRRHLDALRARLRDIRHRDREATVNDLATLLDQFAGEIQHQREINHALVQWVFDTVSKDDQRDAMAETVEQLLQAD